MILGIDPSLRATGYILLTDDNKLIESGVCATDVTQTDRNAAMLAADTITKLLIDNNYEDLVIGVELPYLGKHYNVTTFSRHNLFIGRLEGALLMNLSAHWMDISTSQAKKSLDRTIKTKEDVLAYVMEHRPDVMEGYTTERNKEAIADAFAVANAVRIMY